MVSKSGIVTSWGSSGATDHLYGWNYGDYDSGSFIKHKEGWALALGLVIGKWHFEHGSRMPKVKEIAEALAIVMGTHVLYIDLEKERPYVEIPVIGESLFDVEYGGNDITIHTFIPAHPYLWENLDCVLSELGGTWVVGPSYWHPQKRFGHLRRTWSKLSWLQKFILKIPAIGASRMFDCFL